jgi:hypothetical protein
MPFLAPVIGAIGTALSGISTFLASGTILSGIVKLGLGLAAQFAVGSLIKKKAPTQTVHLETQYGEDLPRTVVLGKRGLAGHHVYRNSYGRGGRTVQDVYVLSHFRINGVTRVRYKGKWKSLLTTETDHPERGFRIDTGDRAKIWIKVYQGALNQAADPDLIDKANPSGRWTSAHRLAGLAYAFVTHQLNQKDLPQPWEAFFEVEGICYDWRYDDTEGGDGAQRWADPTTWAPSVNPMVQAYNLERGFYLGDQLIVGKGAASSRLPLSQWTLAANISDEMVYAGGVSGPRYTSSYIASAGQNVTHSDNMEPILAAAAASWVQSPGAEYPIAGANQASVVTITDDDLLVDENERVSLKRTRSELVNTIAGTYAGPDAFYEMVPLATRTDADAFAADRERLAASIPYESVIDPAVGDRLNDIALRASRYQANADICLRQKFLELKPGQWITWTSNKAGGFTKTFQVTKRRLGPIGDKACRAVYLTLQEVGEGIFDPTAYITNPPATLINGAPDYQSELVNFGVVGIIGEASTGSSRAGIRATWDLIDDPTIIAVDLEYGPISATGAAPAATALASQDDETATIDLWQGVMSKALFAVRYRLRSEPPRTFFWSGWVEVTTDQAGFGTDDILDGAITELKVAAQAISTAKLQIAAVTADILSPNSVTNTKIADAALTVSKFAADITPVQIVDTLPASGTMVGQTVYNTGDGQLYTWNGTSWDTSTATVADGSITAVKLAEAAVTASKLASGAVTHDAIAAGSVYGDVIAAQSITARELILTDFNNLVPDNQMQVPDMWDVRPTGTSEAMWSMQNNSAGDWNSRGLFKFAVASKTTGYTGQESDFFPVKPGAKYRAATQVYASDLSKVNNIFRVLWYDVNKTLLSYNDWFNGVPTTQFNTSTVTAPSGVAYATAAFYVFQDNTTVDAFYAGVFVAEQNAASLIVDGGITTNLLAANSITAGLIAAAAVTADKLAAKSVTAKSLVLTDATNLVPDNQIQDAASWGYAGTGPQSSWFMTANGPPWQSAGIFKYDLTQKTTGFTGRISQRFPVKGGKTYRLSGQCWNNNETTATFNVLIRVDWLDLSEQYIVSSYILNYGGPGSSLPLTSVVTVAAPGNAARAQYAIYVNQDATTASGVWFGGPIVREMNAAELIVDGGIITNMLAADSVTADKIQVNSLEAISATLGNVVVNGALIQDATIVNAKTGPLFVGCVT